MRNLIDRCPPTNLALMELVILRFCLILPMWTPTRVTSTGPSRLSYPGSSAYWMDGWEPACLVGSEWRGPHGKAHFIHIFGAYVDSWEQHVPSAFLAHMCVAFWIHVCFIVHGRPATWPPHHDHIKGLLRCWFHPYDEVSVVAVGQGGVNVSI